MFSLSIQCSIQETSEEAEHVSVEMADVVESLGKLKDEIIKTDLAYRKIEIVAKEKKIESDLVILWLFKSVLEVRLKHDIFYMYLPSNFHVFVPTDV